MGNLTWSWLYGQVVYEQNNGLKSKSSKQLVFFTIGKEENTIFGPVKTVVFSWALLQDRQERN